MGRYEVFWLTSLGDGFTNGWRDGEMAKFRLGERPGEDESYC